MNKKNNRKGFTIVELVIVIAVIAILAVVLVPTFGNVIAKAKNASLISEIKNEHTNYVTKYADKDGYSDTLYIMIDDVYYLIQNGELQMTEENELTVPAAYAELPDDVAQYWDAATDAVVPVTSEGGDDTPTEPEV